MPKYRRKAIKEKANEQPGSSDEDGSIDNDNCSEFSGHSDARSNQDEGATESEIQQKLDDKVLETIDNLTARSAAARTSALVSLRGALQRRYLGELLANQRATLADLVARAIRRGRDSERKAAAAVAPLLSLQIGEEGIEEFMAEVRPTLVATCVDQSASLDTRTECCSSLAVLCYLLEEDISEILEIMKIYETIFSGSYLKGDGSVKVSSAVVEAGGFHAAALDGWALLLALLPPPHARALLHQAQPSFARLAELLDAASLEVSSTVVEAGGFHAAALDGWALLLALLPPPHARALLHQAQPSFARLAELLDAASLEVRMAAGTALAVAHERVSYGEESDTMPEYVSLFLPRLDSLARDSQKFRAKRDRKVQRATFRDILKYIEEDTVPSLAVRIGTEVVECHSWASRIGYAALAAALGGGLSALAARAQPLRHALGLGEPPLPRAEQLKLNKLQRHLQNTAASKARTVARNKSRDKRSAALAV